MTTPHEKITGILLAGGRSTRMGQNKGMIPVGDRLLYQYPLRILESLCDEILVSTCIPLNMAEDHEQVCDEVPGIGPAGGIMTCLERSSHDLNIIVSYDMPLLHEDLFRLLLEHARKSGHEDRVRTRSSQLYDIILPEPPGGQPEPLCGLYRKSAVPTFRKLINQRNFAVHRICQQAHTLIVPVGPPMPFYHHRLFENVNSRTDLDSLPPQLLK